MQKPLLRLGFAVWLFALQSAWADTVTTYTSLANFQAAAGTTVTEDFTDSTLQTGLSITFGQGASISGGVFNAIGSCIVCESMFPSSQLNFSPATSAFGGLFDLTPGGNGGGLDLFITFSNATTTDAFIGANFNGFFGVVSNGTAISSIKIKGVGLTGSGESYSLDNAIFASANGGPTAVPEPASVLLFGTLLTGAFITRSLRQRRS
jgi:hypothetical protein